MHGSEDARQRGICMRSGFEYPMEELVKEWTGLWVHRRFADIRNPQDFVTGVRDDQAPRVSSPEAPDVFVSGNGPSQDDL